MSANRKATLAEQLEALPVDRRQLAEAYMRELVAELARPEGTVRLTDEERDIVSREVEGARKDEFASDEEVAEAIGKPWR